MRNVLPWDLQTKVLRVLWTILSDFLAKQALQKAFKNFMKFKASLPVPILFRWSPRFPRHDTSMLLLSILSTSSSANNLFKLFKVSVAFPLSVLRTGWEIIILHSGLLILIYGISNLIFFRITVYESLTVLLVPTCSIKADGFFLINGTKS